MFSRCRATARVAGAGHPLSEFWFMLMVAWGIPVWIISAGGLFLQEMLRVSRMQVSGVIEAMSGIMLLMLGGIMEFSSSIVMRQVLESVVTVDLWVWSSVLIGLSQLIALRWCHSCMRSVATLFAFMWWSTMALRLYSHGLLLTHSQLITMSGATALSLFILRFQTEWETNDGHSSESK
jgi:hypothetical protein